MNRLMPSGKEILNTGGHKFMFLSMAIDGFLLARTGNSKSDLSPKTIALYRDKLFLLVEYLDDPDINTITAGDLSSFMDWLEDGYKPRRKDCLQLSSNSRDKYWVSIKSFFGWAEKELKLPRIDEDLPRPAIVEDEIIPYSREEITIILDACRYTREANTTRGKKVFKMHRPTEVRDGSMVLLLLETGIRVGELSRLKIGHVDLENGEIHIIPYRTGKKSKARSIPFGKVCKKALWKYKMTERYDALPGDKFFDLEYRSIQGLFYRIGKRTGIPDVYPHRFRHTFAIQYLRNGGDVFTLQKILGHGSMKMVRRYLAIAQSDIKNAHRRASPVDRWEL